MGFSSYQSEYPYEMTKNQGSVLSPIFPLLNKDADSNFIIFQNIYYQPINKKFNSYIVDVKKNMIINKFELITNSTNILNIKKNEIDKNFFFYSDGFLGIPIYVSIKDGHFSMEHTHPPHLYLLGEDKYLKVNELKKHVKKIISK